MANASEHTIDSPEKRYPFEFAIAVFALIGALSQYGVGTVFDKTGEQVRSGVPIATCILALTVLATIIYRKRLEWPIPSWTQVTFLTCLSLGLLGLHRTEIKGGIKEAIQVAEIFGLAWYLFATLPKRHHQRLFWTIGIIGVLLIPLGIAGVHRFKPFMLSEARLAALHLLTLPFVVYAFRSRTKALAGILAVAAVVDGLYLKSGLAFVGLLVMTSLSIALLNPKRLLLAAVYLIPALSISLIGFGGTTVWQSFSKDYGDGHAKRLYVEAVATAKAPSHYPAGGGLGEYKRTINQLKPLVDLDVSPKENKIPKDGNSQYLLTLVEAGLPAAIALMALFIVTAAFTFRCKGEAQTHHVCALAGVALAISSAFTTTMGRGVGIWTGAVLGLSAAIATHQRYSLKEALSRIAFPVAGFLLGFVLLLMINDGEKRPDHVSAANARLRRVLGLAPINEKPGGDGGLVIIKPGGGETTTTSKGIRVEGEAFLSATGPLRKAKANGASQGEALTIPLNSGKGTGEATYELTVPTSGKYLLRARVQWEDGCSNSITFVVANTRVTLTSERFGEWHDLDGAKRIVLDAGTTKVVVENVEDGIRLDYFELIPVI